MPIDLLGKSYFGHLLVRIPNLYFGLQYSWGTWGYRICQSFATLLQFAFSGLQGREAWFGFVSWEWGGLGREGGVRGR